MHPTHLLREGATPAVVPSILGHPNINVTQDVCGKSRWEEREENRYSRAFPVLKHWPNLCRASGAGLR